MTNLNPILEDLVSGERPAVPKLDCLGCTRPQKCCDFQPFVANFQWGAHLEKNPEFSFAGSHLWQPLGLVPSHVFRQRHAATAAAERGVDLTCQFFDCRSRRCEIWEIRPGECSTYFCEGRGERLEFLSQRSFDVETRLAQRALCEIGFSLTEVHAQIDLLNAPGPFQVYSESHLREIYRQCWLWVNRL